MKMQTDGGYGWVVVTGAWIIFLATTCFLSSFGILYISYSEAFQQSKATTGWIGSIQLFFFGAVGIFGAILMDKFGARNIICVAALMGAAGSILSGFSPNIYILYVCNILIGPSTGLLYMCSSVTVQQWFDKRRTLAAALSMSGIPIGHTISGPLTVYLESKYSWRGTLIIFSGILLNCLIGCSLLKPAPILNRELEKAKSRLDNDLDPNYCENISNIANKSDKPATKSNFCKSVIDVDVLKNRNFLLFNLCTSVILGQEVMKNHLPSRAVYLGISRDLVGYFPLVFGICQCITRPLGGWLGNLNLQCLPILRQFNIYFLLNSTVVCLTGFTGRSFVWMMVCSSAAGTTEALYLSIHTTLITLIVGVNKVSHALGMHYATFSLVLLIGTPFGGWLFDMTQNYDIPFFVCGGIQFLAGLIALFITLPRKRESVIDDVIASPYTLSLESIRSV